MAGAGSTETMRPFEPTHSAKEAVMNPMLAPRSKHASPGLSTSCYEEVELRICRQWLIALTCGLVLAYTVAFAMSWQWQN